MTDVQLSPWWPLQLAGDFPGLEIYTANGWGPEQELGLIELGDRVMDEETDWLLTWLYSEERDRVRAAVSGMLGMVADWIRSNRPEDERVILALKGEDGRRVDMEEIPEGWRPGGRAREGVWLS